jgi:hypothetical protein
MLNEVMDAQLKAVDVMATYQSTEGKWSLDHYFASGL